ncbi:MAG TPA: hypothetical protein VMV71_04505 [Candidatus Paceibacterota bacterium]|nr:hypothetical protein [Candidatus Paceibacterota bacterium]
MKKQKPQRTLRLAGACMHLIYIIFGQKSRLIHSRFCPYFRSITPIFFVPFLATNTKTNEPAGPAVFARIDKPAVKNVIVKLSATFKKR